MKFRYVAVLMLLALFSADKTSAQYSKLIVQFTDKANSPYSFSRPGRYLSQRAIDRRMRYKIKLDSSDLPVTPLYIQQVVAQGPVTYLSQSKWLNQVLIRCNDAATINAIRALPFVKNVSPVGYGQPQRSKGDRFEETLTDVAPVLSPARTGTTYNYGNSYNQVHMHNGEFLHDRGFTGNGMVISILDAGFYQYRTVKAFDSVRKYNRFLGERDFVAFDGSVNEDNSHGEYCLSTIAANVPGVMVGTAPDASFWLLRSEDVASELPIEEHNWVAAAEFSDSAGADLISSSLGYFTFDNAAFNHTYANFYNNSTMVSLGATYAARKGMIVTNSAGNEGGNSWKYIIFPSDSDSVCSVAATDASKNIAYFSSYGYPGKVKPNIASQGQGTTVYTSFGVSAASGTSFSNPNINGLIACLWQAFPEFNNIDILKAVYKSADRVNAPDNRFGYGIPDMKKAYNMLMRKRNGQKYGDEWFFVERNVSNTSLQVKLLGRIDGTATIQLLDKDGKVVRSTQLKTAAENEYNISFGINQGISPGNYTIRYTDGEQTRMSGVYELAIPVLKSGVPVTVEQ